MPLRGRCLPMMSVLLMFLLGESLSAQTVTGAITGSVVDSSGLPVPKAQISLLDQQNGVARSTAIATSGAFQFLAVPPGVYTVILECPGFATVMKKNLNLTANE